MLNLNIVLPNLNKKVKQDKRKYFFYQTNDPFFCVSGLSFLSFKINRIFVIVVFCEVICPHRTFAETETMVTV